MNFFFSFKKYIVYLDSTILIKENFIYISDFVF